MNPDPELIISPFVPGPDISALTGNKKQCNLDRCTNDGTMKCGRCHTARYCSKECQIAHWRQTHKRSCQNPTAESTFVPEIPSSWRATRAPTNAMSSQSIRFAR